MDASSGLTSVQQVFARRVHESLRAAGKSADELAKATHITPARLRRILNGEARRLTLREMAAISTALETPLSALLER